MLSESRPTDDAPAHERGAVKPPASATALIVGGALFMQMLDVTIVATALPSMARSLNADPLNMSMVITSYLLTLTAFTPVSGWVADRYGALRVFLWAVALFTLSSLACALASTLETLIVARLVQGVAGALMVPVGRVLIVRTAPKAELVNAMAYLAIPALIAPVLGPPIGGLLVVHASWPWIFLINAPVGVVTLVLSLWLIKADPRRSQAPFDWRGALLCSVGLASLILGLEASSHPIAGGVSVLAVLIVGMLCGLLYVLHARGNSTAVLNLTLFKIPTFAVSAAGSNLCSLSLGAMPFLLTLLLQVGFGLDALRAATIALAMAIGSIAAKLMVSRLVNRWGVRRMLTCNGLLGGSLIMCCALLEQSTAHALIALLLFGIGLVRSLQLTVANTLGYADIAEGAVAAASSLASTLQYLALAAGVSLAALCMHSSVVIGGASELTTRDIDVGFITIGALFSGSSLLFARLSRNAGGQLLAARPVLQRAAAVKASRVL